VLPPPAPPPRCRCNLPCVWERSRWWCGAKAGEGCGYECSPPPRGAPTPLCLCGRPAKFLVGKWWCAEAPGGGCALQLPLSEHATPPARLSQHAIEADAAREIAATLTAAAYGVADWAFVAACGVGLGLFARADIVRGQVVAEYAGPRLPGELAARGAFVLDLPGSGTVIDGAYENSPGDGPFWPGVFANHSARPNAALEYVPAMGGALDAMVLVATEAIEAGSEVRFNYDRNRKEGKRYWGRGAPAETGWREERVRPPAPAPAERLFGKAVEDLPTWTDDAEASKPFRQRLQSAPCCGRYLSAGTYRRGEWSAAADARLRKLLQMLHGTQWHARCSSRPGGKERFWEVVATHFYGRSPAECQGRWRAIARSG